MSEFTVALGEFRMRLTALLNMLKPGRPITIERWGAPVAILIHPDELTDHEVIEALKRGPTVEEVVTLTNWLHNYGMSLPEAAQWADRVYKFGFRRLVPNEIGWTPGTDANGDPLPAS